MTKKIGFTLDVKDGWPPYAVEHIWVEPQISNNFRILNFPFFVKGIAFEDVIHAELDSEGYVLSWTIVEPSTNSTMWIIGYETNDLVEELIGLGCGVEEDTVQRIISVNIPHFINLESLNRILEPYEAEDKVAIAIPVDRIGLR